MTANVLRDPSEYEESADMTTLSKSLLATIFQLFGFVLVRSANEEEDTNA